MNTNIKPRTKSLRKWQRSSILELVLMVISPSERDIKSLNKRTLLPRGMITICFKQLILPIIVIFSIMKRIRIQLGLCILKELKHWGPSSLLLIDSIVTMVMKHHRSLMQAK